MSKKQSSLERKIGGKDPESAYQTELRRIKDYAESLARENKAFKMEAAASRRIIWAMLEMVPGKKLEIPDLIMAMANSDKNEIESYYDTKNLLTVLKSSTKQSRIISI